MSTLVVLSNIGTPASPSVPDVRAYLAQFLMDPDVVSIPYWLRLPLVRGWIVPRRAPFSAAKYATIWSPEGSPLMVHSRALRESVTAALPEGWSVTLGMRYGEPSIDQAIREAIAGGHSTVLLAPLFPQYARATTGSISTYFRARAKKLGYGGEIRILPPFATADFFVGALARILLSHRREREHVLFTFHGLPESQVRENEGCLVQESCCDRPIVPTECYRAQCFATANALAKRMELGADEWSVSFQSRLGRARWIGPYTDDLLKSLPAKGIRKLLVASPSFVSDCLETLEELGVEGRHTFQAAGGETYTLAPCVNSDPEFVRGLAAEIGRR